jgi:uncharacterized cupin superfamily protein
MPGTGLIGADVPAESVDDRPTVGRTRDAGPSTSSTGEWRMSKKIDIAALPPVVGTTYPPPFDGPCLSRERRRLGDAAGLTQFGVNLLRLPPGAWSSQRHWHTESDELVYVLSGEVTLVTDDGAELLKAGDAAGFKAGDSNGHCLQNRSAAEATVLEIGTRARSDGAFYPDIDLAAPKGGRAPRAQRR